MRALAEVTVRAFGKPKEGVRVTTEHVPPGTTLATFLAYLAQETEPSRAYAAQAILLNGQSVARKAWGEHHLEDGDVIAIIPMLVGG